MQSSEYQAPKEKHIRQGVISKATFASLDESVAGVAVAAQQRHRAEQTSLSQQVLNDLDADELRVFGAEPRGSMLELELGQGTPKRPEDHTIALFNPMGDAMLAFQELGDHRDSNKAMTDQYGSKLEEVLWQVQELRAMLRHEMLTDELEATTFGVTGSKLHSAHGFSTVVDTTLEDRMRLLEMACKKIKESTTTQSVNEQPLANLGLWMLDLWKSYIPLAIHLNKLLVNRQEAGEEGAFVVGINAGPGSGKSTMIQVLLALMDLLSQDRSGKPLRVVQFGSDDLYMTKEDQLANDLETRLDPRSLDKAYYTLAHDLKHATSSDTIEIPAYNKGADDRDFQATRHVTGPFDLVLYEGWRVGVMEGDFEGKHFEYNKLNDEIELLIYIHVPANIVWGWKLESSKRDFERENGEGSWGAEQEQRLNEHYGRWIPPFVTQHEEPLMAQGGLAHYVITKDAAHHIVSIKKNRPELAYQTKKKENVAMLSGLLSVVLLFS